MDRSNSSPISRVSECPLPDGADTGSTCHPPDDPDRRVGLREVAAAAGVSRATASLVLRDSPLVAAATRARVHEAMARLGYVYNRAAANMRRGRSGTIGLLLAQIGSPFYAAFAAGLDLALDGAGLVSVLANADESPARQKRQLRRLCEHGVDGVVLCPAAGASGDLLDEIARLRLPCVQTLRTLPGADIDSVVPDYALAMEQAVGHLRRLGRQRLAYIGIEPVHSAARDRLQGFRRAMRHAELADDAVALGPATGARGGAAIARLMAAPPPPDAVICYNDEVAFGVAAWLLAQGLLPGRDVAVIGADDQPLAASAYPALSSIATGPGAVGEATARLLLRRIAEPERPCETVLLPAPLVIRESCGARRTR